MFIEPGLATTVAAPAERNGPVLPGEHCAPLELERVSSIRCYRHLAALRLVYKNARFPSAKRRRGDDSDTADASGSSAPRLCRSPSVPIVIFRAMIVMAGKCRVNK